MQHFRKITDNSARKENISAAVQSKLQVPIAPDALKLILYEQTGKSVSIYRKEEVFGNIVSPLLSAC